MPQSGRLGEGGVACPRTHLVQQGHEPYVARRRQHQPVLRRSGVQHRRDGQRQQRLHRQRQQAPRRTTTPRVLARASAALRDICYTR